MENFSCNNKTNCTRRHKFITHKNNCCQIFSRSCNDQPLFVNKYKFKEGCQSSSPNNKFSILGDPGADSGGEGKSKRAEKYGTKKSKERREKPLGTMSYQTSSKRSPPFCILIGQKNTKVFWHQSEGRTAATVWNWSGKTLSPGGLVAVFYFSSCHIFPPI